jgi:hypothetical protein
MVFPLPSVMAVRVWAEVGCKTGGRCDLDSFGVPLLAAALIAAAFKVVPVLPDPKETFDSLGEEVE